MVHWQKICTWEPTQSLRSRLWNFKFNPTLSFHILFTLSWRLRNECDVLLTLCSDDKFDNFARNKQCGNPISSAALKKIMPIYMRVRPSDSTQFDDVWDTWEEELEKRTSLYKDKPLKTPTVIKKDEIAGWRKSFWAAVNNNSDLLTSHVFLSPFLFNGKVSLLSSKWSWKHHCQNSSV